MQLFLGIDIAKLTFDACLIGHSKSRDCTFTNDKAGFKQLIQWINIKTDDELHVTMEATGRYYEPLADFALNQHWFVYVLNPCKFKHYAQSQSRRHKTDKADAQLMARYLSKHYDELRIYQPPSENGKQLKDLSRRRNQLVVMRKQESNRLGHLQDDNLLCESHKRLHELFDEEIQRIEKQTKELIEIDEKLKQDAKNLQSIPNVGKVLSVVMLSELGDITRFKKAKDVTAWLGLAPMMFQSGTSVRKEAKIARGNGYLRRVLYMAAMGALTNKAWKPWIDRHRERGKLGKKLIVAVMDKILRICWGVLKNNALFDKNIAFSH